MSQRYDRRIPLSLGFLASVLLHVVVVWLLASNPVLFPLVDRPGAVPRLVEFNDPEFLPPDVDLPAPVAPIVRPPPPAETIAETTVPERPPPTLTPPEVIPHDIAPRLLNGADVLVALEAGYPEELPAEAAQSHVLLWLFVDTGGNVRETRVESSSGFEQLDALATQVAPAMRYSPARYQGERVAVWVAQRIRFQPRTGSQAGSQEAAS